MLAIRLGRMFFDEILARAIPSTYSPEIYATKADWESAVVASDVRLQWDPDHDPQGKKLERRAIQLGLRGQMLARYGNDEIREIIDVSQFVEEQRNNVEPSMWTRLITPHERVYIPARTK